MVKKSSASKANASAAEKQTTTNSKKLSAIDAAAQLLATATEPMSCQQLIEAMATQGLWTSPGGATPAATLYSALVREISTKGKQSRFKKKERGKFVFVAAK